MALGTPEGTPKPGGSKRPKPEPKVVREVMFQVRKVLSRLPSADEQQLRYQKRHNLAWENKLLRAELERFRQERQSIEDFYIRMSLGESQRRDAELAAKQQALDQALAGPNGAELAAFQHETMVLKKRLQDADLELATVKAELAQSHAERDGQEFRLKQWLLSFDDASRAAREASDKVERLTVELETVKNQNHELRHQRHLASAGETEEWYECSTHDGVDVETIVNEEATVAQVDSPTSSSNSSSSSSGTHLPEHPEASAAKASPTPIQLTVKVFEEMISSIKVEEMVARAFKGASELRPASEAPSSAPAVVATATTGADAPSAYGSHRIGEAAPIPPDALQGSEPRRKKGWKRALDRAADAARERLTSEERYQQDEQRARVLAMHHTRTPGASSSAASNVAPDTSARRIDKRVERRVRRRGEDTAVKFQ